MKTEEFLDDIIGGTEEKWIREAENIEESGIKKKRRIRLLGRAAAAAACLGLIIFAVSGFLGKRKPVQAADLLENYTARPVEEKSPDDAFIRAGYDWAVRLFRETYRQEEDQKTLLVSPLSVMTALAMTANGAGGQTLREMEQVLGSGSLTLADLNAYLHTYLQSMPSSDRAKFSYADGIWFNDRDGFTVEEAFLQQNVDYYDAAIRKSPFSDATIQEINQWVALHTDDMIPELLDHLEEDTRMVLVNALAFNADWREPFVNDGKEYWRPFTNLDGSTVRTPVMTGEVDFYLEDDSCIGFEKPYIGDTYRFAALLPKDEKDFAGFIDSLNGEKLASLMETAAVEKVRISLPKFSYDYTVNLPDVLKTLGIRDAFDPSRADLSGISRSEQLYISKVLHKTHIDLDSAGTRAAAATEVEAMFGGMPPEPREVFLDRPFVYMIVDTETGLPILIGTVTGFPE